MDLPRSADEDGGALVVLDREEADGVPPTEIVVFKILLLVIVCHDKPIYVFSLAQIKERDRLV